jgi:Ca2+-binding RTX toxin-like protein
MSKRIKTVTAGQESIDAALALENEQSVVAPQALHADSPESGDATLVSGSSNGVGGRGDIDQNSRGEDGDATLADESVFAISLGDGDDIFTFDFPVNTNFEVDANGGNDQISAMGGRNVYLYGGLGNDSLHVVNNGIGIKSLDGGVGDDVLIVEGVGTATLTGGDGSDSLNGGDGNDQLDGGAGADTLAGGDGYDIAGYWGATAGVSIDLTKASSTWTGDAQGDAFTSIEAIFLTNFADTFRGDANANTVFGGSGNDQIFGGGGNDSLIGEDGNDTIQGGEGNDVVYGDSFDDFAGDDYLQGNAGDDVLFGDLGNDRIVGGTGNDTVVGGLGGDYLAGNEGADIFQYTAVNESQAIATNGVNQLDQIADFTQGQDKIDLSAIDANRTLAGNQAFVFIADPAHYTGNWTGVVWQTTAANGIVTINVSIDGDADAEMQIYMSHPYQLTANDFIL